METKTKRFKRIAAGDYETEDGRYRLYQLPGVNPPAWNVEEIHSSDLIVDGAATKRDALALFAETVKPAPRYEAGKLGEKRWAVFYRLDERTSFGPKSEEFTTRRRAEARAVTMNNLAARVAAGE